MSFIPDFRLRGVRNRGYKRVQDQFSSVADAYVKSSIHAKGEDLKLMLSFAGDVAGKQVLDIATGAGHTAFSVC